MNFKTRLTTALATGAVLLNALAPVALAQEVTVSGNGAFSDSTVNVTNTNETTVNQTNTAEVTNNVTTNADTGGNDANFNTGGDVAVSTGDASTNVAVSTGVNKNVADLDCDCISGGDTKVTVSGNGAFSDNTVGVSNNTIVALDQTNNARVTNNITANSDSGDNDANFNTGGDVTIGTGNASSTVLVKTDANLNSASIGGGAGTGNGSSVTISGNGAFSDNTVRLRNSATVDLDQENTARVTNNVTADADTGNNDALFSTGGDVMIGTGNAKANVGVSNLLNFNSADVDCDCIFGDGVKVVISGNGAFSDNVVGVNNTNALLLSQLNTAVLMNNVTADADTGDNDAGFSVGAVDIDSDPSIHTGDASTSTVVSNSANANILGDTSLTLPGNWSVGVSFNMVALWAALLSVVS